MAIDRKGQIWEPNVKKNSLINLFHEHLNLTEKLASGGGQTHISHIPDEHLNQLDQRGLFSVNVLNPKDYQWAKQP